MKSLTKICLHTTRFIVCAYSSWWCVSSSTGIYI